MLYRCVLNQEEGKGTAVVMNTTCGGKNIWFCTIDVSLMRLQAYRAALESLGHSEYALKAGFHLNPKVVEAALQVCCLFVVISGKIRFVQLKGSGIKFFVHEIFIGCFMDLTLLVYV